tara:strand:+ start:505 stop:711 length:207 start_codon:yes stop_codon:yes gene_type:complete
MDTEQTELINRIKRQTNYTEEEIIEKLKDFDNDEENVIRDFHGILEPVVSNTQMSNNQKIFKAIREKF